MIENVLHLMHASPHHQGYTVDTILRCITPPLDLAQHTYVIRGGQLVAWASWAWLPDEKAEAFLHDQYRLRPDDWCSGDKLVFMDFIAPFGHALTLYGQLRHVFKDTPTRATWVRFAKQGKIVRVKNG